MGKNLYGKKYKISIEKKFVWKNNLNVKKICQGKNLYGRKFVWEKICMGKICMGKNLYGKNLYGKKFVPAVTFIQDQHLQK